MLLLASNSPRRRQLLSLGGWTFKLVPVGVDENPLAGERALDYVLRLAAGKARSAAARAAPGEVVVAADTTVVDLQPGGETILGKPVDAQEAGHMLRRLRGRVHRVCSGIAVLRTFDGLLLTDFCVTEVPMRDYSDEEMQDYIASGDPLDKAGAYAIQHPGFRPVEALQGCYANVVGLPLCHLTRTLNKLDISPQEDIPSACQSVLHYECPIFHQVLQGDL